MIDQKKKPTIARLPHPGDVIDGRYRLGEALASGGMGIIMKAEQIRTGREVAIKLLHPHIASQSNFAARFKREANVATLFDHRAIVRVYDVGETNAGVLYLVMELLQGVELKEIIAKEAPLPARRVVDIGLQMLDGLAEAHSQGVVHRDVKPSNVFICTTRRGEDEVKLLDFGVAKLVNSAQSQVTATGSITGTPSYIAPEVMVDTKDGDRKTADIYAAGLVILEMLTGFKVFEGNGMAQTLLLHLKKPVQIPEPIARLELGAVIRKATAKHPDDRYPDADAMYLALRQAQASVPQGLVLKKSERTNSATEVSTSLLEQIHSTGERPSLDILRQFPQHESVPARGGLPDLPNSSARNNKGLSAALEDEWEDFDAGPTQIVGTGNSAANRTPSSPGGDLSEAMDQPFTTAPAIDTAAWKPSNKKKQQKLIAIIGGAAALVVIAVVMAVVFTGGDDVETDGVDEVSAAELMATDSDESMEEQVEAVAEEDGSEEPSTMLLRIESVPDGAAVLVDDEEIGTTNFELEFEEEEALEKVVLRKEGYQDQELNLSGESEEHFVVLEEKEEEQPREAARPSASRGSSGGSGGSGGSRSPRETSRPQPTPSSGGARGGSSDDGEEESSGRDVDSLIDRHLFGD